MKEQVETVKVKVKLPKQVLEFLKNTHAFMKIERPFDEWFAEWLSNAIVWEVDACLNSQFEPLINAEAIRKIYGLTSQLLNF